MAMPEPSVVITNRPCVLIKREGIFTSGAPLTIDQENCSGCKACLKIGCPAIEWQPGADAGKGKACIDPNLCNGCQVCGQLCKFDAIGERS